MKEFFFFSLCSCLRSRCRCRRAPSPSRWALPTTRPAGACPSWMFTGRSTPSSGAPCQQHRLSKYEPRLPFTLWASLYNSDLKRCWEVFTVRIGKLCIAVGQRILAREMPLSYTKRILLNWQLERDDLKLKNNICGIYLMKELQSNWDLKKTSAKSMSFLKKS